MSSQYTHWCRVLFLRKKRSVIYILTLCYTAHGLLKLRCLKENSVNEIWSWSQHQTYMKTTQVIISLHCFIDHTMEPLSTMKIFTEKQNSNAVKKNVSPWHYLPILSSILYFSKLTNCLFILCIHMYVCIICNLPCQSPLQVLLKRQIAFKIFTLNCVCHCVHMCAVSHQTVWCNWCNCLQWQVCLCLSAAAGSVSLLRSLQLIGWLHTSWQRLISSLLQYIEFYSQKRG